MDFCKQLIEKVGLVVTPGIGFGEEGENFFRLAMTVENAQIDDALNRLQIMERSISRLTLEKSLQASRIDTLGDLLIDIPEHATGVSHLGGCRLSEDHRTQNRRHQNRMNCAHRTPLRCRRN